MVAAVRPLLDRERALQHILLLRVVASVAVRDPETIQHFGHFRTIATVLALIDWEHALEGVAVLDVVADVVVRAPKLKQPASLLSAPDVRSFAAKIASRTYTTPADSEMDLSNSQRPSSSLSSEAKASSP